MPCQGPSGQRVQKHNRQEEAMACQKGQRLVTQKEKASFQSMVLKTYSFPELHLHFLVAQESHLCRAHYQRQRSAAEPFRKILVWFGHEDRCVFHVACKWSSETGVLGNSHVQPQTQQHPGIYSEVGKKVPRLWSSQEDKRRTEANLLATVNV